MRALLACLLLEPNQVVPMDRLIDTLWDDEPPVSARTISPASVACAEVSPGSASSCSASP